MPNPLQIKNIPEGLEDYLLEYANELAQLDKDPKDVHWPEIFHAEFIDWPNQPERWGSAWGGTSVLALLEDHSQKYPAPKTRQMRDLEWRHYAETSAYNLPPKYQKQYMRTVIMRGKECSSSDLTHAEFEHLCVNMSEEDLEIWAKNIETCVQRMARERDAYATFEWPVRVHLTGTDDTSYSKTFPSREAALASFEELKQSPRWASLKIQGYLFTN